MARAQPCSKQVLPALATTLPHSKGVLCPQLGPTSHFQGKGCNPNCIQETQSHFHQRFPAPSALAFAAQTLGLAGDCKEMHERQR